MTRFGEISPLWLNFKSLGQFIRVYLVFGKILILLYQKCFSIWHVFIVVHGPILENNLAIWSHWLPIVKLIELLNTWTPERDRIEVGRVSSGRLKSNVAATAHVIKHCTTAIYQCTFVFVTRGHCIKGKPYQHVTIKNETICLSYKQSSLFSFYALPSGSKPKCLLVHCVFIKYTQSHIFMYN